MGEEHVTEPFNKLTPAQAERLTLLAEEACEVAQIAMKILRHGYASYHPSTGEGNVSLLNGELADMQAAWNIMARAGDVEPLTEEAVANAEERKLFYMHHQQGYPWDTDQSTDC